MICPAPQKGTDKMEHLKKLFKAIYGELIHEQYQHLDSRTIAKVAFGAVKQFAEQEGIVVEFTIK